MKVNKRCAAKDRLNFPFRIFQEERTPGAGMQFRGFRGSVMRSAIAISGALLVGACTPVLVEYHYMSFVDVPGIKVLEYGKVDVRPMFGHKDMPLQYELKRDEYTLFLSVDMRAIGGERMMLKTDRTDWHVRVVDRPEYDTPNSCGAVGRFVSRRTIDEMREKGVLHLWGVASAYCGKRESGGRVLIDKMPGVLDYQILNDDGDIVAEERLHFKLVRNGTYLGADGP